jgi:predicted transcriptional regulator
MNKIKGTIEVTNDGKIKLKKGSSYHVTVRGRYNQTTAANTYGDISYIEYITNQSIHVNVDNTIADAQYFELSYDLYKLNNDSNYYVYFSMNGGTVNDLFIEIHAIGSVGVDGSGGGTSYTEGNCIDITSNVISWETTAGITDIQMVTALPQDPVSSVLYIIPEV